MAYQGRRGGSFANKVKIQDRSSNIFTVSGKRRAHKPRTAKNIGKKHSFHQIYFAAIHFVTETLKQNFVELFLYK